MGLELLGLIFLQLIQVSISSRWSESTPSMLTQGSNLGVHSCKIRQSDGFVGVPVFRSAVGVPLRSGKLGENIVGLGRMAGFEYNATPYALRRAYANVLYANVSAEDRRFLMGHKTNSDIYSHYHSAVSTVNVQEIFRGIRAGNATEMHGLSLNRIQQMPQNISKEGWQRVQRDPEIAKEVLETSSTSPDGHHLPGRISHGIRRPSSSTIPNPLFRVRIYVWPC